MRRILAKILSQALCLALVFACDQPVLASRAEQAPAQAASPFPTLRLDLKSLSPPTLDVRDNLTPATLPGLLPVAGLTPSAMSLPLQAEAPAPEPAQSQDIPNPGALSEGQRRIERRTEQILRNIFSSPQEYREMIKREIALPQKAGLFQDMHAYVFPTKYCPVGCSHCYFGSPRPQHKPTHDPNILSDSGVSRLVDLFKFTGVRKLVITGGGDPIMNLEATLRLIRESEASSIELHTSAYWAKNPDYAEKVMSALFDAFLGNPAASQFTVRLSLDAFHKSVPDAAYRKVIEIFKARKQEFSRRGLNLAFHSLHDDQRILDFLRQYDRPAWPDSRHPASVTLAPDWKVSISYSPLMPADTSPDMRDIQNVQRSVEAFDRGRVPRPAVSGPEGREEKAVLVVHQDGSAELWNSGPPDRLPNIYTHSKEELLNSFSDPVYAAAIEEGAVYVENIIKEVDPHSVNRAKTISSATFFNKNLLAEARTRLYVSIRIIQDWLAKGKLVWEAALNSLPAELHAAIRAHREELIELFHQSGRSIVDDYLEKPNLAVEDLLALNLALQKGHFRISISEMREKVIQSVAISQHLKTEYLSRTQGLDQKTYSPLP